ncbi:MAG: XAC2610-related protein, partial [Gammaproteobacteria bacterium]
VENKDKQVVLLDAGDKTLIYAVVKKNGAVEFSYPEDSAMRDSKFKYSVAANQRSLTFGNKRAAYTLYEDTANTAFGIKINVDGKTYHWKGLEKTRKGSLALAKDGFDNVVMQ